MMLHELAKRLLLMPDLDLTNRKKTKSKILKVTGNVSEKRIADFKKQWKEKTGH